MPLPFTNPADELPPVLLWDQPIDALVAGDVPVVDGRLVDAPLVDVQLVDEIDGPLL